MIPIMISEAVSPIKIIKILAIKLLIGIIAVLIIVTIVAVIGIIFAILSMQGKKLSVSVDGVQVSVPDDTFIFTEDR